MIARTHGVVLAALLGLASVAGAYATITTVRLGEAETKPEVAAAAEIARRRARLDEWEVSLRKALAARPPALPAVPRYARADLVGTPSDPGLPTVATAAAPTPTTGVAIPAGAPTPRLSGGSPATRHPRAGGAQQPGNAPVATRGETVAPEVTAPAAAAPAPEAPASAPPDAASATVAAPATTPSPQPVITLSKSEAERQCEALKKAAEKQGEAAKREAERRCEELKKSAEGGD